MRVYGGAYANLPVKLAILTTSSPGSIGLGMCIWKPAARELALSSTRAQRASH